MLQNQTQLLPMSPLRAATAGGPSVSPLLRHPSRNGTRTQKRPGRGVDPELRYLRLAYSERLRTASIDELDWALDPDAAGAPPHRRSRPAGLQQPTSPKQHDPTGLPRPPSSPPTPVGAAQKRVPAPHRTPLPRGWTPWVEVAPGVFGVHVYASLVPAADADMDALTARLELFRAFAATTQYAQSVRNAAAWVVFVDDPKSQGVLEAVRAMLALRPNFVAVRRSALPPSAARHPLNLPPEEMLRVANLSRPPPPRARQLVYMSSRLQYDEGLPRAATAAIHAAVRARLTATRHATRKAMPAHLCWLRSAAWYPSRESHVGSIAMDPVKNKSHEYCVRTGTTLLSADPVAPSVYATISKLHRESPALVAIQTKEKNIGGPLRAVPSALHGGGRAVLTPAAAPVVGLKGALQARYGIGLSTLQRANEAVLRLRIKLP